MVENDQKLNNIVEVLSSNKFNFNDVHCYILFKKIFTLLGEINLKIFDFVYDDLKRNFSSSIPSFSYNNVKKRVEIKDQDKKTYLLFDFDNKAIAIYNERDYPVDETLYEEEKDINYKTFLLESSCLYYYYYYDIPNNLTIEDNDYYFCDLDFNDKGDLTKKNEMFYLSALLLKKKAELEIVSEYNYAKIQVFGKKMEGRLQDNDISEELYDIGDYLDKKVKQYEDNLECIKKVDDLIRKENKAIISTTVFENNSSTSYKFLVDEDKLMRKK